MNNKLMLSFFLLFLILGCSKSIPSYKEYQQQAKEICDNRNGELIHFGLVENPETFRKHYESVCFKKDEQHFYYDLIE